MVKRFGCVLFLDLAFQQGGLTRLVILTCNFNKLSVEEWREYLAATEYETSVSIEIFKQLYRQRFGDTSQYRGKNQYTGPETEVCPGHYDFFLFFLGLFFIFQRGDQS